MIGTKLNEKKATVLDIYSRFLSQCEQIDGDTTLELLHTRAQSIRDGKYRLAIVGETSAGKSTLINALLEENILPTHTLQSSSAIVEIFNSDKENKFIEVEFANKKSKTFYDDPSTPENEAAIELAKIGALQQEFRSIPTGLIDSYIIRGLITNSNQIPYNEMEKDSDKNFDKEKRNEIKRYIDDRKIEKIPEKIKFGLPLNFKYNGFILVDSPGVNAVGGVQDQTFEYIINADAILFVYSLQNHAENKNFKEFVKKYIPNRNKKSLFLTLTKSGTMSEDEIQVKMNEIKNLYKDDIKPDHIVHVDSLLKIISSELNNEKFQKVQDLKTHYNDKISEYESTGLENDNDKNAVIDLKNKRRLLNDVMDEIGVDVDKKKVIEKIITRSNFDKFESVVYDLSSKAPEQQLADFLLFIKSGYSNLSGPIVEKKKLLKIKDRQKFIREIKELKSDYENFIILVRKFNENMNKEYSGSNLEKMCSSELKGIKNRYLELVDESEDRNEIRKFYADFHDDVNEFISLTLEGIKIKYATKLDEWKVQYKEEHEIDIPNVNIDLIFNSAELKAEKIAEENEGFFVRALGYVFKNWRINKFLGRAIHVLRKDIKSKMNCEIEIMNTITEIFINEVEYFNRFIDENIESRKIYIDELKKKHEDNEVIIEELKNYDQQLNEIKDQTVRLDKILVNLGAKQ